jgi:hypothetical protein
MNVICCSAVHGIFFPFVKINDKKNNIFVKCLKEKKRNITLLLEKSGLIGFFR